MPFYKKILDDKKLSTKEKKRIIEKIIALRAAFKGQIPDRTLNDRILLATWNIREFDSAKGGARLLESFYYIAEIIDRFDLVAIQEIRDDLSALNQLKDVLGGNWDFIYTDVTEGTGGNKERMAFLYDTRKIYFSGLAGEAVMPPTSKMVDHKMVKLPPVQWARSPFMCGFRAGWTSFILVTVHMYYGTAKAEDPTRVEEIKRVADFIKLKADDGIELGNIQSIVMLGDFNIFDRKDATFKALDEKGFKVPPGLAKDNIKGSNVKKDKFYDQIVFLNRKGIFEFTNEAGIFDFYEHVFKEKEVSVYLDYFKTKSITEDGADEGTSGPAKADISKYLTWRTFQMSDHLPMWVEIQIDNTTHYLNHKAEGLDAPLLPK